MACVRQSCLSIVNTRSGVHGAAYIYARSLQLYLNKVGVTQHTIHVPATSHQALQHALECLVPSVDVVVVCGGDGTVHTMVNMLAQAHQRHKGEDAQSPSHTNTRAVSRRACTRLPSLLIVPTGVRNAIALSLGMHSADGAVSCWVAGRSIAVPLWRVCMHGTHHRLLCAYLAVGTLVHMRQRHAQLRSIPDRYLAIPAPFFSFAAATVYTVVKHEDVWCDLGLRLRRVRHGTGAPSGCTIRAGGGTLSGVSAVETAIPGETAVGACVHLNRHDRAHSVKTENDDTHDDDEDAEEEEEDVTLVAPLRSIVVAQMPFQQRDFSLTPQASFRHNRLCVTVATESATRLRMWHLMRCEASDGYVDSDDGVVSFTNVTRVTLRFHARAPHAAASMGGDDEPARAAEPWVLLDGELVALKAGSELVVERSDFVQDFLS